MTLSKILSATTFAVLLLAGCNSSSSQSKQGNGNGTGDNGSTLVTDTINAAPTVNLSDEQKYTLAYMWHEEKLAYEIYLALNAVQPAKQFVNIATKSEINHMGAVEILIAKYDINVTNLVDYSVAYSKEELSAMPSGIYTVPEVQKLYDDLYEKGVRSLSEAFEVGCIVEVTDVNDLNHDLEIVEGIEDITVTFEWLRQGSYSHYWAFDSGLKGLGITDGCCSLGEFYCKTTAEYPT